MKSILASGIAIAGAGPLAQAMGRAFAESGMSVACVASRTPGHAAEAAAFIGGACRPVRYDEIASCAGKILIAVSDAAIEPVAQAIAASEGNVRIALHTCGSYGPEPLHALAAAGVSCGSIHPLQTIHATRCGVAALRGIAFGVTGDPDAAAWAGEIAGALGGEILHIDSSKRQLYHAAAVLASNYITVTLAAAKEAMILAGVPEEDALRMLAPLVRTSVENAIQDGPVKSLTGPIARGDAATVAAHVRALETSGEMELYRAAGLRALRIAQERGFGEKKIEELRAALLGGR